MRISTLPWLFVGLVALTSASPTKKKNSTVTFGLPKFTQDLMPNSTIDRVYGSNLPANWTNPKSHHIHLDDYYHSKAVCLPGFHGAREDATIQGITHLQHDRTSKMCTISNNTRISCAYKAAIYASSKDGKETKVKCYELGKMAAQVAENCRAYVPTSFRLDFSNEMWYWAHHEILGQSVHQDGTTVTVSNQHYEDKKKC